MSYRDSDAIRRNKGVPAVNAGCADGGRKSSGNRRGEFRYRTSDDSDSAHLHRLAKDEEARLKQDYRDLKNEARDEYKNVRARIMGQYEERLTLAKQQYLEDAVTSREKLLMNRQLAREEYEESLRNAKNDYEFAVDIVKDHYRTMQKETTRVLKRPDDAMGEAVVTYAKERGSGGQSAPTRVIARLDEEIKRVSEKKAAEKAGLDGKDELALAAEN